MNPKRVCGSYTLEGITVVQGKLPSTLGLIWSPRKFLVYVVGGVLLVYVCGSGTRSLFFKVPLQSNKPKAMVPSFMIYGYWGTKVLVDIDSPAAAFERLQKRRQIFQAGYWGLSKSWPLHNTCYTDKAREERLCSLDAQLRKKRH